MGGGQEGSRGAVRGSMVIAAEAAYAEGEAGNEAMCWAQLRSVVESDGEVGFGSMRCRGWCRFRHWL